MDLRASKLESEEKRREEKRRILRTELSTGVEWSVFVVIQIGGKIDR